MKQDLSRRTFLTKGAAIGAAAATSGAALATPAIAQELPTLRWRLTSGFPNNLDTIYGGGEEISVRLKEATDGKFNLQVFAAGEIVPGLDAIEALPDGGVRIGARVRNDCLDAYRRNGAPPG